MEYAPMLSTRDSVLTFAPAINQQHMKKTVIITGSSSGIGKAAVKEFAQAGWNVVATMRNPADGGTFKSLSNVKVVALDVTDSNSVASAFKEAIQSYGTIDVVVNNAGYGVDGVFEAMPDETIQKQFDTNVVGLMRVTREAVKHMRPKQSGIIIQISSMGGKITFPLYSIYHSTKFAVEGFTESLQYELLPFNIRLKLVEPGLIATEFTGRSRVFVKPEGTNAYDGYLAKFAAAAEKAMKDAEDPQKVAAMILKAASDGSSRMRYPVGAPAPMMITLRKWLSDGMFMTMIRKAYKV